MGCPEPNCDTNNVQVQQTVCEFSQVCTFCSPCGSMSQWCEKKRRRLCEDNRDNRSLWCGKERKGKKSMNVRQFCGAVVYVMTRWCLLSERAQEQQKHTRRTFLFYAHHVFKLEHRFYKSLISVTLKLLSVRKHVPMLKYIKYRYWFPAPFFLTLIQVYTFWIL